MTRVADLQRYVPALLDEYFQGMMPDNINGQWVKYDDVIALIAKLETPQLALPPGAAAGAGEAKK